MSFKIYDLRKTAMILAIFAISLTSQAFGQSTGSFEPAFPHDFSDNFYLKNGVNPKAISKRLTGTDNLSTFEKTNDSKFSIVRVLITMPAYDQNGETLFWSPLGQITSSGFTNDAAGFAAMEIAKRYPIYVFPDITSSKTEFGNMRQSVIIDDTWATINPDENPLGLRAIVRVNYTSKAFTKSGQAILNEFIAKNGMALDGGPIIKSVSDIQTLLRYELITTTFTGSYAISPIIRNVDQGAIARDAFLSFVTRNGKPLPTEDIFVKKFNCYQQGGTDCGF